MSLMDRFNFGWIGRKCSSIRCFVVVISLMIFCKIGFNIYLIGVLRTIERKYGLSSKQSGLILSANDVVHTSVVLFVGHFARKYHKPSIIGYMNLVTICGYVIMALPHFLLKDTESAQDHKDIVFAMFILAQVCIGFGSSATIVHGFSYVDDNADQRTSPVYIGIMMSMFSLAPLFGYSIAAISTKIPEDLYTEMVYDNSIGAWWLGFLIIAAVKLTAILALLLGFPEKKRGGTGNRGGGGGPAANVKDELNELPRYFGRLLTNGQYVMLLMESLFASYTIVGVFTYMPRFLEIHFHVPAFKASLFSGCSAIFGFLGAISGGAIMKRLRMRVQGAAGCVVLSAAVTCACLFVTVFMSCPQDTLVRQEDFDRYMPPGNCSCPSDVKELTCYEDVTYFSSCLAKCSNVGAPRRTYTPNNSLDLTTMNLTANGSYDGDTLGIPYNSLDNSPGNGLDITLDRALDPLGSTPGFCSEQCNMIYVYLLMFSFMILIVSLSRTPTIYVFFRIIESSEKSFALALRSFLVNIFCFIPGPLFYGHVIDTCCETWFNGACLLYDTDKFRVYTYGLTLIFNVLALLFAIILCLLLKYKKTKVHVLNVDHEHIDLSST